MEKKNIDVNSTAYSKLSKKDKLIVVEEKLNDLFEEQSSKYAIIYYNGEKKHIPFDKQGICKDLLEREKSLIKYLNYNKKNIIEVEPEIVVPAEENNNLNVTTTKDKSKTKVEEIDELIKQIKIIMNNICGLVEEAKKKKQNIIKVDGGKLIPYSKYGEYKKLKGHLEALEKAKRELLTNNEVEKASKEFNVTSEEKLRENPFAKEENPSQKWYDTVKGKLEEIDEIANRDFIKEYERKERDKFENEQMESIDAVFAKRKPLNNEVKEKQTKKDKKKKKKGFFIGAFVGSLIGKIKNKFKRTKNPIKERQNHKRNLKVKVAAFLLAGATLIGAFLPNFKKKDKKVNVDNRPSYSTVENAEVNNNNNEVNIHTENTDDKVIIETDKEETPSEENIDSNIFDYNVTLNNDAKIYRSSYDAASENNSLRPYYNGEYDRQVQGAVYNLNGKIYTIYTSDAEASNKAKDLLEQGATLEALLVTRTDLVYTGDYEGYYNIDDVKTKTRVR